MSKSSEPTIQEKMTQLDALVEWFRGDDFELEQASVKLKEAAKLAAEIEDDLRTVENDIRQIKASFASENGE